MNEKLFFQIMDVATDGAKIAINALEDALDLDVKVGTCDQGYATGLVEDVTLRVQRKLVVEFADAAGVIDSDNRSIS